MHQKLLCNVVVIFRAHHYIYKTTKPTRFAQCVPLDKERVHQNSIALYSKKFDVFVRYDIPHYFFQRIINVFWVRPLVVFDVWPKVPQMLLWPIQIIPLFLYDLSWNIHNFHFEHPSNSFLMFLDTPKNDAEGF